MRLLVPGHRRYIGTVMVPMVQAGDRVVGLDTHMPISSPERIQETQPNYASWSGQFVVPIPDVKVYP